MRSVIRQSVVLPASPETLFGMYLSPDGHEAITGVPAKVGPEPGAEFEAFGGALKGQILETVPSRVIVQSWRSTAFTDDDPDSMLILSFTPEVDGGRIDLIHVGVPEHDYDGVTEGWESHYWVPWRKCLEG